jgi:hypothetical protein
MPDLGLQDGFRLTGKRLGEQLGCPCQVSDELKITSCLEETLSSNSAIGTEPRGSLESVCRGAVSAPKTRIHRGFGEGRSYPVVRVRCRERKMPRSPKTPIVGGERVRQCAMCIPTLFC